MNSKLNLARAKSQRGVVLILVLLTGLMLTLIGLSLADVAINQFSSTSADVFAANASQVAEAGIEQSLGQLNGNPNFSGYASPQAFFNNSTQGYGTFVTTVAAGSSDNEKIITSTAQVYHHSSSVKPVSTRKIKVTVVGTSSSGYSVFSGPGGLILGGSATIVNSSVYADGYISLSGASQIGSNSDPLQVDVANDQCPAGGGAAYPQVCANGSQPISLAYSTHIYGSVCATGQTSTGPNNNISGGSGGQGLKPSCTAPKVSPPAYDRQAQINAVTTTASGSDTNYNCSKWKSGQGFQRTWPANLELTGNVSASSSCDLTITGNVYITGNLTVGGAANIKVADSVGTTRPVIIVDGTINIGGSGAITANSSGTGVEFISFKSSASCSPSCASVTGTDLYNSQKLQTVTVGGATNMPGVIFDAYWGKISIGGSGTIGSAIGQTVDLSGAGTITFGTSLSSGQRTWTIRSYQQLYDY